MFDPQIDPLGMIALFAMSPFIAVALGLIAVGIKRAVMILLGIVR